jgi:hypothetical protein
MNNLRRALTTVAVLAACSATASAQGPIYDPEGQIELKTYSCAQHLEIVDLEDGRGDVRTVWAHGYYSALHGIDEKSPPVTAQMVIAFAERLEGVCKKDPEKLLIVALKEVR